MKSRRGARNAQRPEIALRRAGGGPAEFLDDVVVRSVEMFRAEVLERTRSGDRTRCLWLCCYLPNGDRITWHATGRFDFYVVEEPEHGYRDADSGEDVGEGDRR
ncbi:MAG: hypothetical protein GEU88_05335 [Solirubrobacterales bacterium]|nr:hypothetical protein [Solirubrobacterales bacterium]